MWPPNGGITSKILHNTLKHIDSFDVLERKDSIHPFHLLDGYNSRFELPFLEYVTSAKHKWIVCVSVPYETSLWQVGNLKQWNRSFKIALARKMKDFFQHNPNCFIDPLKITYQDIIPLFDEARKVSFSRVHTNLIFL